jgi:glutamine amidotransferase
MKIVAIVNYGMGNLDSVYRAVEECGGNPVITNSEKDFQKANFIILPGVGSFATGILKIREFGLDKILTEQVIEKQIPFLGICLGMQLMATKGYEGVETPGLNWVQGEVVRLKPSNPDERIPHVGWNEVIFTQSAFLNEGVPSGKDFYFVHSFHLMCHNEEDVIASTPFCGKFVSAVRRDNIFGVQFHPEKSQKPGFQVIRNFLSV